MQAELHPDPARDPRHQAILRAGFDTFARYGFRRTSMADIAREAGMSRAALYLHFRNKEDVFTQLVQVFFEAAAGRMQVALEAGNDPEAALARAFAEKGGAVMESLFSSPHGDELMDLKATASAAAVAAGEARLTAILSAWLTARERTGQIRLEQGADATARLMIGAVNGVKESASDYPAYIDAVTALGRMFGRALRP